MKKLDRHQEDALDTILSTDAYKLDHRRQYPEGTEFVFSNLTARGSRIEGLNHTVFFGLQAVLRKLEERWRGFFQLSDHEVTEVLESYDEFVTDLLGPNGVGSAHFYELWELGHLPLRIRATREGTIIPTRVPFLTYENTDARFGWLTNYLETELSAELWHPINSATIAWRNRGLLDDWAEKTGDPEFVAYQGHDFSYRGLEGTVAAAASGAGHLVSFIGSDTLPAVRYIQRFYDGDNGQIAASVPATEHAVMCAGGKDGEFETFERLLDLYPTGILSVVSDTWDLWQVLTEFLPKLKDKVLAREGKLVIRPDSGDPELILCGDPSADPSTPQYWGVIHLLETTFGATTNEKGYLVLDSHVGAIYGDSITYERADAISRNLAAQGYASTNAVYGFGSFTYQYQTRDTFKMAVKATWVQVNGEGRDIFKDPITDDGSKKSATGRLAVRRWATGEPYLIEHATEDQEESQMLGLVFENGEFYRHQSFEQVRHTLRVDTEVWKKYTHV